jgi:hypothetical protein
VKVVGKLDVDANQSLPQNVVRNIPTVLVFKMSLEVVGRQVGVAQRMHTQMH